ncbi:MAG: XdhC/CoxI family protein [bacterium]|nr:XdhC/CoxI family protein [bacterium]
MSDDLHAVYEALYRAQQRGEAVALATVVHTHGSMPRHAGSKLVVRADGTIVGTVGGGAMEALVIKEALAALDDGQTRLKTYTLNSLDDGDPGVCGGTAQIFIEPVGRAPTLLVIGGGHVGKALAELGKWAGYRVCLSDDRPEFCNSDYAPGLDSYLICKPGEITQHVAINGQTYVAAVTRGLPVDLNLIPALLATNAPYIGLIGSRRRWTITVKALEEQGITPEQLARVRAPIGLELQAETPKEIALSILAEIVMIRRGGTGKPMSLP